jgi:hypothetical protein
MVKKAVGGKHKRYVFKTNNGGVASAIIKLKNTTNTTITITITPMRIYMILVFCRKKRKY